MPIFIFFIQKKALKKLANSTLTHTRLQKLRYFDTHRVFRYTTQYIFSSAYIITRYFVLMATYVPASQNVCHIHFSFYIPFQVRTVFVKIQYIFLLFFSFYLLCICYFSLQSTYIKVSLYIFLYVKHSFIIINYLCDLIFILK